MLASTTQKQHENIPLSKKGFSFQLFHSIYEISETWDQLTPFDEYWMSDYHRSLENALPEELTPFYAIISLDEQKIGCIYLQWKKINLRKSIRVQGNGIFSQLKKGLLNLLRNNTLVVGNLLLTGKYGFHFKSNHTLPEQFEIVNEVAYAVCNELKNSGKFGTILFKDFFETDVADLNDFDGYTKFSVQPNMIMNVRKEWTNINGYADDLKAKARTRFKRTLNKLHPISCRELQYEEIETLKKEMLDLYLNIAENASFNLFYLNENYFPSLKKEMGDKLKIIAFFDAEGTLKGFYSIVKNFDHLDAHFLGYDAQCNKENLLYLNMLFDMVTKSISLKVEKICMSRTAVEIKSSVGAYPLKMFCYLKHRNTWLNKLVAPVIQYLYQDEDWIERNPFK